MTPKTLHLFPHPSPDPNIPVVEIQHYKRTQPPERQLHGVELGIWSLLSLCFKQGEVKPHHAIASNFHLEITLQENDTEPAIFAS